MDERHPPRLVESSSEASAEVRAVLRAAAAHRPMDASVARLAARLSPLLEGGPVSESSRGPEAPRTAGRTPSRRPPTLIGRLGGLPLPLRAAGITTLLGAAATLGWTTWRGAAGEPPAAADNASGRGPAEAGAEAEQGHEHVGRSDAATTSRTTGSVGEGEPDDQASTTTSSSLGNHRDPPSSAPAESSWIARRTTTAAHHRVAHQSLGDGTARVPLAARASTLPEEARLLTTARWELAENPGRCLAATEAHGQRFPSGALSEEREALAIEALARLGRRPEARARFASFVARFASSPYRPRLTAVLAHP